MSVLSVREFQAPDGDTDFPIPKQIKTLLERKAELALGAQKLERTWCT